MPCHIANRSRDSPLLLAIKEQVGIIRDPALCMQQYIEDPTLPEYSVESVLRCPTVRVEYEQAFAIGGIGECLAATSKKTWGAGPQILPLALDDWFYPERITYVFKENSLYNRRFEQRRR